MRARRRASARLGETQKGATAKAVEARAAIEQANSRISEAQARLDLARKRVGQNRELVAKGAGNRFDLEQAETSLAEAEGQLAAANSQVAQARASEAQAIASRQQVVEKLGGQVGGEYAQVAQINAQLESAQWNLDQTTTRSPCDCFVINLQLRPGGFVAGLPLNPVMTLVEADGRSLRSIDRTSSRKVQPGDEAEFALETYPGRIVKGKVDSVVWAIGRAAAGDRHDADVDARQPASGTVRRQVRYRGPRSRSVPCRRGFGDAAIYTQHASSSTSCAK